MNEAIRLLGVYTAGRFDIWSLAGSSSASCRAHVMSALVGKRVPQSKSGVNAIQDALYAAIGAQGDCLAAREEDFLRKVVAHGYDVSPHVRAYLQRLDSEVSHV